MAAFSGQSSKPLAHKSAASNGKAADAAKDKTASAEAMLCILEADGKPAAQFPLDFKAEAVNLCPDGNLALGGDGTLARYDLEGKELRAANRPMWLHRAERPRRTQSACPRNIGRAAQLN